MENPFGNPAQSNSESFNVDIPADIGDGNNSYYAPPGRYAARCDDLVRETSKNGNPMWVWTFRVAQRGPAEGKTFRVYTVLTPAALWKLSEVLVALDLGRPGQKVSFDKSKAIGRPCTIVLVDETYEGKKRATIDQVLPLQDQSALIPISGGDNVPF